MLRAILFDLDDTLITTDSAAFMARYFRAVGEYLGGIADPREVPGMLLEACERMIRREHPADTNLRAFSEEFCRLCGVPEERWWPPLWRFYEVVYPTLGDGIAAMPGARSAVLEVKERALKVVVATNPVFPLAAIRTRLQWGGLADLDFDLVTGLDNMHHAKPQPGYYLETASMLGVAPVDCLVVGNDFAYDIGPAKAAGMWTFYVGGEPSHEADAGGDLWAFTRMLRDGSLPGSAWKGGARG